MQFEVTLKGTTEAGTIVLVADIKETQPNCWNALIACEHGILQRLEWIDNGFAVVLQRTMNALIHNLIDGV